MTPLLAAGDPFEHTWNTWDLHFYTKHIDLRAIPGFEALGISNFVLAMIVAAVVLLVLGLRAGAEARRAAAENRAPRGFGHVVEVLVQFVRDEMMRVNMPHHYRQPFLISVFCTFFFFILLCNLIGLLPQPFGHTATGSVYVTGALAFGGTFLTMIVAGMLEKGVGRFWIGLVPHGVPWWMWPLLFVIELVGLVVKPFALTIRLAANMTAGHIILAVLMGFLTLGLTWAVAAIVWPVSAFGFLAITIFEIAIAFIQAYIFTVLSTVFVGASLSHEH